MTEPTPTPTPDTPVVEPQQGDPAPAPDLGDAGKKAIDAERRRAAAAEKEAKALKARLDELEAANLSELEKAQKAAAEATARLAEFEQTTMRQRVALAKGLPAELVDRLRGATEDEMAADADALLALVNAPRSPRPDLSQGPRSTAGGSTADQFAAALQGFI